MEIDRDRKRERDTRRSQSLIISLTSTLTYKHPFTRRDVGG